MKNLGNILPGILNTGLSIIRDKNQGTSNGTELVHKEGANGVSISGKRVLNALGTVTLMSLAYSDIQTNGINKMNLALAAIGVVFCVGMELVKHVSEKK